MTTCHKSVQPDSQLNESISRFKESIIQNNQAQRITKVKKIQNLLLDLRRSKNNHRLEPKEKDIPTSRVQ
jgi:hypothetical protein